MQKNMYLNIYTSNPIEKFLEFKESKSDFYNIIGNCDLKQQEK